LNTGIHYKAIYPFSVYMAFLLEKGNFHKAFRYEDLIIHLCRKYPDSSGQTRGLSSIVWLCLHWRKSPAEVYDYCLESIESGKRSGDRYHTGLSYCAALWSCIYQAKDLKMIEEQMFKCDKFAERYDQSISKDVSRGIKAALVEPMKVDGKMISMKKNIDIWLLTEDFIKLGNYYILAGMTQYYLGNYQKANEYLNQGEYYLPGHTGNILNRIWHIFFMLNSLRMTGMDLTDEKKDAVLTKIRTSLDKVKFWANFGPALNPYLALIYAEQKRIFGNFSEARNLYLDAIDIASEHEYVLLKGHILECLGELLFENRNEQAEFYIKKASEIYMKCNADQKYHLLRNRFTKFFQTVDDKKDDKDDLNYHISYNKPFETVYNKQSYKVNFNSFIEISAQFFIEIFGATHGYFIVEENSSLVILCQWIKKKKFELIVKKESLSNSIGLSKAIVRYVWRTKKSFFLDNAIEEGPFVHDRDVQQFKLRSVICQPIFNQEKLAGIIYMQNNHSSSMFTDNLRKFLEIIASQLVISLETGIKVDDYKDIIKDLEETREKLMVAEPLSMIGQLSGSISHELRNPLGVIDSSVYYLIKKLRDTDDPKIIQHLDRIREHVKRSTAIIESLQKLMQMEEPTKKSIELSVLLDDAISASQVPESIEVSTKLANSNIYIFGDYEQLRMTFTNIIKNAIEAMEGKGRLIIQADLEDGRFVKLFFKDTGAGISSNNINRVFQPLFSTKPRGMGFGLSICQRIVEMHKGTIAVESDSNKGGSIFTVQLPFNYQALN
ncbi:MAG: GAF domain-containing sensor histidine kinase, partial [Spirochaetota bacterium]|nr:GAF domain-containing sensor histidine kinase [Spirochaetota bacterium]